MPSLTANRGLVTLASELTRPDGSLTVADNVNIDADNVIESRRGFAEFGTINPNDALTKQVLTYKGRVLKHYANKIAFDSTGNGDFVEFSGNYLELINRLRIKYIESNSNLYFTTQEGIKKISATSAADLTSDPGFITNAGGVKAVGFSVKIKPIVSGWFPAQSKVAYKVLWASKDANGNIIRGVPSSRVVLSNTSVDINVGERFTITVLDHNTVSDGQYFTFDTPTNKFAAYYDKSGNATPPIGADLLGRQLIKITIHNLNTDDLVAAATASSLQEITDISVTLEGTVVTVSNIDGGNVTDANQGTLNPTHILISKVFDGQTATGISANVELTIPVPTQVKGTSFFFELYRTALTTVSPGVTLQDLDPGEEFQKVYEAPVTQSDITNGEILFEDITPETFREGGAFLYVNPVSGEGIARANEAPPVAHDVALFKGSVFYANTKERHRRQFNFLSVSDFVSGVSKFIVGNSSIVREYTFIGQAQVVDFTAKPKSETLGNSYYLINSARNAITYKLWFDKGIIQHSFLSAAVNLVNNTIIIPNHLYATNEKVSLTSSTNLTNGIYYITRIDANTIQLSSTPGGMPLDLTTAGDGTITHTPEEPILDNTVSLRAALQVVPDTIQGSVNAFIDAFFDVFDFTAEDQGLGIVRVSWNDNGEVSSITESTPATGWDNPNIFTLGIGEDADNNEVLLSGLDSVGLSIEDTARSLERVINKDPLSPVSAFYLSGLNDLPGILLLESRNLIDDAFYIACNSSAISTKFNPELPVAAIVTDIAAPSGVFTTNTDHGFFPGQEIYIHDNTSGTKVEISGKFKIATTPALNTFTLQGVSTTINQVGINGIVFASEVSSDNSTNINRLYFSKNRQPEAVPLVNFIDIGPKDKAIQRILALRDSLIVLKEDGVYVVTGGSEPNFSVRLADSSALINAPDTAVNLNNLIYVLTSQGVATVSETGVGIISRNIENKIAEVANAKFDYKLTSWGVSSESDRAYIMFLPTRVSDQSATQAFRYNTFTRAWTRWTVEANCGVVNSSDDKIYLGSATNRAFVLKERKNFEREDFADRSIIRSIGDNAFSGLNVTISSAQDIANGDVLTQEQYLDINKFNRILKKLDRDQLISDDYFSTLKVSTGANLANSLNQLYLKLQQDNIMVPMPSSSNEPVDIRDSFNSIVEYLNEPFSGTAFKDYKTANDLLVYEVLIVGTNVSTNSLTLKYSQKFVQGPVVIYKGIPCQVQYAPQHFGNPETTKQIFEGTFIFDQNNFWGGNVGYASDRSYDFSEISFSLRGPGYWDGYNWSDHTWGGEGNEVPVRTLIPRDKSRCRYLHVLFTHINAREKFRLLGVSLEPRAVSTRGYR